jgi:excisionase family DNA binding protein
MPAKSSRIWTKKEVAQYLGISEITVLRMIQSGDVPAYKVRGRWRLKEEDIECYLQERSTLVQKGKPVKKRRNNKKGSASKVAPS